MMLRPFFRLLFHNRQETTVVWHDSTTWVYTAKDGYRCWFNQNCSTCGIVQCHGWNKIWSLLIPHKVKIFIWRFCRNLVPVRSRLSSKGIRLPITCPMCNADVEHLLHLFFDCHFAVQCWNYVGLVYDMRQVENAFQHGFFSYFLMLKRRSW